MMTPVWEARRWMRIGSWEGRGGDPAGRTLRRRSACSRVSGLGRVRILIPIRPGSDRDTPYRR
jgi:hypothetical protein